MNLLNQSTFANPKKAIKNFTLSKNNKCKCGKTQDSNGNCDGSHAK